jgi:hypothetical protein
MIRNLRRSAIGLGQRDNLVRRRAVECIAMGMIGDGALALVEPRGHAGLWQKGPANWQRLVRPFVEHPAMIRCAGALGIALGLWLALRQERATSP